MNIKEELKDFCKYALPWVLLVGLIISFSSQIFK